MAGKRQHFIPRFLQEGFASRTSGDNVFTWVYRKDNQPFETNIINVGVEGDFYTQIGDTEADDVITDKEGAYSKLVHHLRTTDPSHVTDPAIPELIVHLEARTRHLRQGFLNAGSYLSSRLMDFIADGKTFIEFFERKVQKDPSIMMKVVAEELIKKGIPITQLEQVYQQLIVPLLPEAIDRIRPMVAVMADAMRPRVIQSLKDGVKSGHIRVMKDGGINIEKVSRYKQLTYQVVELTGSRVILGDSIIVFQVASERAYKTFLEGIDKLEFVYLPLSPHRVLVGSSDPKQHPKISPSLSNEIARCSLEYFISDENSEENRHLQSIIGDNAAHISINELEDIISESMDVT